MERTAMQGNAGSIRERGAALFIMVVTVMVAGGLAMALAVVAAGRQKATDNREKMEKALCVAEAGLSRGLAEANLRVNRGNIAWPPVPPAAQLTIPRTGLPATFNKVYDTAGNLMGEFRLKFTRGDVDREDNDGDGLIDAADTIDRNRDGAPDAVADEGRFVIIDCTGYMGLAKADNMYRVRVRGQFEKPTNKLDVHAAVFIDDPTPLVDLGSSNSYTVSGLDHDMYSKKVLGAVPPLPAVATTGTFNASDTTDIINKSGGSTPQITGTSPTYQNSNPNPVDFPMLVEFAREYAEPNHIVYGTGTNPPGPFGQPPGATAANPPVWEITLHDPGGPGNLVKFSSNITGAGLWIVNGDLEIGGTLNYTGIIVVTGAVRFVGGGATKMVTGAVISGQTASVDNLSTTGTIDLLYSGQACAEAVNALVRFQMEGFQKLSANP